MSKYPGAETVALINPYNPEKPKLDRLNPKPQASRSEGTICKQCSVASFGELQLEASCCGRFWGLSRV